MLISSFKDIRNIHAHSILHNLTMCIYVCVCTARTCHCLCAHAYTCVCARVTRACVLNFARCWAQITHREVLLNFVQTSLKTLTHGAPWVCIRNINAHINFVLTFCHPRAPHCSPNRQKLFLILWSRGEKHIHLHAHTHTLMKKCQALSCLLARHIMKTQIGGTQSSQLNFIANIDH